MNKMRRIVFVVLVSLTLTTISACAGKTYSGFLKNYPKFESGPVGGANKVYIKEGVDFRKYDKIMMDHVVFFWKEDADYKGINADELKELSDAFHKAVAESLKDGYPLVSEPGPDVLRIRVAITEVTQSRPGLNTFTALMPIGLGISFIKKGITGTHSFVGTASMEAEFLDSQTNERLAAAIDTKGGEKYKLVKGFQKWGHAKEAFKYWAGRLRKWLDKQHGKS